MKTYLVTGGAGFIGSHLVHALVRRGVRVRVLDNLSTGSLENLEHVRDAVELIVGDATDPRLAMTAVAGVDTVFHEAALPSVSRSVEDPLASHRDCVTSTVSLLDAARRLGVRRFVYAASSSAYGNCEETHKHEQLAAQPVSPYAAAKLAGEYYCRAFASTYGLSTVCLRYFNVFGPRQDPASPYSAVIPLFITALLQGRSPVIFGDGAQSRDFTFVDNVVHGNLCAAAASNRASGRVFNIAMGRSTSLLDLVNSLNQRLGVDVRPQHAAPRVGDVLHSLADIQAAREFLNYEPIVSFDEGLQQTIEYYRAWLNDQAAQRPATRSLRTAESMGVGPIKAHIKALVKAPVKATVA